MKKINQDELDKQLSGAVQWVLKIPMMHYNDTYDRRNELINELKEHRYEYDTEQFEEELERINDENECGKYRCIENARELTSHISNYENLLGLESRFDYITEESFLAECREELKKIIENNELYCKYKNEVDQIGEAYFKSIIKGDITIYNDVCNRFDDIFE